MRRFLLRGSRVVLHTVVGGVLLATGLVMLVTPGPGLVVVALGLAVLAREYRWAEQLRGRATERIRDASMAARARLAARRTPPSSFPCAPEDVPTTRGATPPDPDDRGPADRMRPAS